ncbi:MAG TPA: hypothetical protein VIY07_09560 [Pseudolabrys sp.]
MPDMKLSAERLGIIQKLGAAVQQGEQMAQQGKMVADQARVEAEEFLKMCAAAMGIEGYPETYDFQNDRFVPRLRVERRASPAG